MIFFPIKTLGEKEPNYTRVGNLVSKQKMYVTFTSYWRTVNLKHVGKKHQGETRPLLIDMAGQAMEKDYMQCPGANISEGRLKEGVSVQFTTGTANLEQQTAPLIISLAGAASL